MSSSVVVPVVADAEAGKTAVLQRENKDLREALEESRKEIQRLRDGLRSLVAEINHKKKKPGHQDKPILW